MSIYDRSPEGRKKAILLRVIIVLALLGGIFYIIYNDYKQIKLPLDDTVTKIATTTPPAVNLSTATSKVPVVGAKDNKKASVEDKDILAFPIPNLDRYYSVPVSLDKSIAEQTVREISSTVASLKKDPAQFNKWLELALLRKIVEDYSGAEEIWLFTAKEWPDSSISHTNLGDLYAFYLKDYPKAEISLKRVIEIEPHNVSAYRNLYMLYANQYTEKKLEAVPILLSGIKNNPKSTDIIVLIASHYKDNGDSAKAKEYYNMALPLALAQNNAFLIDFLNKEIKNLSR